MWSGWLFGERAAAPLRDLVNLRVGGGPALNKIMAQTLKAASQWLHPHGDLLLRWRWQGMNDPSASLLVSATHVVDDLAVAEIAANEYVAQASLSPGFDTVDKSPYLITSGSHTLRKVLSQRGEPMATARLRPYIMAEWATKGSIADPEEGESHLQTLLNPNRPPEGCIVLDGQGDPWEAGDRVWWWLREAPTHWNPASDQAERTLIHTLIERSQASEQALIRHVAQQLPAHITPALWAAAISTGGWTFVKFRHLRDMLTESETSSERWLDHLSLDPITTTRPEQMRLL